MNWSALLGFDVFISYRQGEASAYARALTTNLRAAGFVCFFDQEETVGGVILSPAIQKALRKSRILLVIAAHDVSESKWVQLEVDTFRRRRKTIVPVSVNGFLTNAPLRDSPLQHLQTLTWIDETADAFAKGIPSGFVVEKIQRCFSKFRVNSISRTITLAFILLLSIITTVAVYQRNDAMHQKRLADDATARANAAAEEAKRQQALAESRNFAAEW